MDHKRIHALKFAKTQLNVEKANLLAKKTEINNRISWIDKELEKLDRKIGEYNKIDKV